MHGTSLSGKLVRIAALALLSACGGDPAGPFALASTYRLESVGGQPLPYRTTPVSEDFWVLVAESMTFQPDGSVHVSTTVRHVVTSEGIDSTYSEEVDFRYQRRGSRVTIIYPPCGPAENCAPLLPGRLAGDRLIFTWYDPPQPAIFRRIELY
jgi:hypothetical protein